MISKETTMKPQFDPLTASTKNRPHNNVTMNDDTSRLDAIAKVTGQADYASDQLKDGVLLAAYVRCPFGKAKLQSADVNAAGHVAGVLAVEVKDQIGKDFKYDGQNAGYIVAENVHALRRALRALHCQWKREETPFDIVSAEPDWPTLKASDQKKIDAAIDRADFVLDAIYTTQVQTHSSFETHGCRVDYLGDRAVVYGSTQSNFRLRDGITEALGLPEGAVEGHCEYVGGGFGSKLGPGKEGQLAARVSKRFNRPCIVFCNRYEEHTDTGNRPSSRQRYRMGITKSGEIVGGMRLSLGGVGVGRGGGGVGGVRYRLGDFKTVHKDISFSAGAPRAMRAPGHPQGMFGAELMMDELAALAGVDPLQWRKRYDPSAGRKTMYDRGAELIGWDQRRPNGFDTSPVKRGFGMGITDWPNFQVGAEAEVVIHPDGSIEARSGTQDIGTGLRTVVAVVVAEHLGVPLSAVAAKVGNTNLPYGPASGGSVTSPNITPALIAAALDVKSQLLAVVASHADTSADQLEIEDGAIRRAGNILMSWSNACRLLTNIITGRGITNRTRRDHRGTGNSEGVQFAEVFVDTQTGVIKVDRLVAVQACGRVICRKTAENQIIGAVTQGVSYALHEDKILDPQTAAMLNPNFEQYKITGSVDVPDIVPILWDDGSTGVRSLGEPPTIPTSGAIACAVFNAIGVPVRSLPMTPRRVLEALAEKGGAG